MVDQLIVAEGQALVLPVDDVQVTSQCLDPDGHSRLYNCRAPALKHAELI